MPTTVLGELGQKAFESLHFQLTMPTLSALFAPPLTLTPADSAFFYSTLIPWSLRQQQSLKVSHLINVRFEDQLHRPLDQLRRELGMIDLPPTMQPATAAVD
jgi:ubiquinone biosynthesis protein Coq4